MVNVNMTFEESVRNRVNEHYSSIDNRNKSLTTIDYRTIDRALEQTSDLMSDEKYKGWFAKQAYRLGADRYLGIASDARRGKTPDKLFVWLLKKT